MIRLSFADKKTTLFFWVSVAYIIYSIFPIFADVTGITPEIPALLVCVSVPLMYPKALSNKVFVYSIIYLSVLLLFLIAGRALSVGIGSLADSKKVIIEAAWILPAVMIYSVLQYLNDLTLRKSIAIVSLLLLIVSFCYLLPLLLANGYLLRENMHELTEDAVGLGLPNYTLMHAYVYIVPALCYACKVAINRKEKLLWLGVLAIFFYLIVHTYVTTSLVVTAIMFFSLLFYKYDSSNGLKVFVLIASIVYVLYLLDVWSSIIGVLLPVFRDTAVEPKLIDIQQSLTVGHIEGASMEGRMNYHQISIDAFFKNPLFGDDSAATHSSILDRLGGFGLFGFIPFAMIFLSFIRSFKNAIVTNSAKFFWLCTILSVAVFLYNKGLFGAEGWLFFFVIAPSFLIYIQDKAELNPDK